MRCKLPKKKAFPGLIAKFINEDSIIEQTNSAIPLTPALSPAAAKV